MRASHRVVAVAVMAAALWSCTVDKADNPLPTGPSELALSLSVAASPDTLDRDGESQSQIALQARDANSRPASGVSVRLDIIVNNLVRNEFGSLTSYAVVTGSDGRATVVYTAPPPYSEDEEDDLSLQSVKIRATPVGTDASTQIPRDVTIRLVAAASTP